MKQNEQMNEALNEAMNELIPYGYYYNIKGRNIGSATENPTKEQYKSFIKFYIYDNNVAFIATIKNKNEADFKKELDIQLSYYSERAKDLTEWLKHTERLIRKNITDRHLIYAFKEWLNIQHQQTELGFKNEIAMKLIGLIGDYNHAKTIQPVYFFINDVLKEYSITPLEAKEIVLKMKGSVSPEWNKNVIPFIVEHLGQLTPQQNKPVSKVDIKEEPENPYPRIFKSTQCFRLFASLKSDVRERYPLADYSFIYRRMQKDNYIYKNVVDTEFRDFLQEKFSIIIDKTKLLDYCKTDIKESNYTTKKGLFKPL